MINSMQAMLVRGGDKGDTVMEESGKGEDQGEMEWEEFYVCNKWCKLGYQLNEDRRVCACSALCVCFGLWLHVMFIEKSVCVTE